MNQPDHVLANRYELIARIGGGGMGQVWKARDRMLQRDVAVKTVDMAGQDPTMSERFRREAVATAGLSHPNVVRVYDVGFQDQTAFLVMELLAGPSLQQRVRDHGPLPLDEGLRVSAEVTKGLIAAHQIGVVHRDIKPGNVMYNGDDIKLVDFGIAQLSQNMGATLTAPATALGTAAYMSPEQAGGQPATEKADWYALGCLMMTIFSGEPPFQGEAVAVATQQITSIPPRLRQRRPDVPAALDELVAALLTKDPQQRPDGHQVLRQLRALQQDPTAPTMLLAAPAAAVPATQTAVYPRTPAEPPQYYERSDHQPSGYQRPVEPDRSRRRGGGWLPVAVALVFLAVAGVAIALWLFNPGPQPTPGPTPSATPTARATTTTRAPQTTRTTSAPTPTRTTVQPTTPAPAPTTQATQPTQQSTGNQTQNNNGNATGNGSAGAVMGAINQVQDKQAKHALKEAYDESRSSGNDSGFWNKLDELQKSGAVSGDEFVKISLAMVGG